MVAQPREYTERGWRMHVKKVNCMLHYISIKLFKNCCSEWLKWTIDLNEKQQIRSPLSLTTDLYSLVTETQLTKWNSLPNAPSCLKLVFTQMPLLWILLPSRKVPPGGGLSLRPFSIQQFLSFKVTHSLSATAPVMQPPCAQKDERPLSVMASGTVCTLMTSNWESSAWTSSPNFRYTCIWKLIGLEFFGLELELWHLPSILLFASLTQYKRKSIPPASQAKPTVTLDSSLVLTPTFHSPENPAGFTCKPNSDSVIPPFPNPTPSSQPAFYTAGNSGRVSPPAFLLCPGPWPPRAFQCVLSAATWVILLITSHHTSCAHFLILFKL